MTMAVGMTSSSAPAVACCIPGVDNWEPMVGDPPPEERSELCGGERDRASEGIVLSSHCCGV